MAYPIKIEVKGPSEKTSCHHRKPQAVWALRQRGEDEIYLPSILPKPLHSGSYHTIELISSWSPIRTRSPLDTPRHKNWAIITLHCWLHPITILSTGRE